MFTEKWSPCDQTKSLPHSIHTTLVESSGRQMPQVIAHRGFKVRYPENTMLSFEGAIRAGAHALETDLHLSRDGVVVLSHDPTLKRCFGEEGKIIDYDLNYLKTLRTVAQPHASMPTLSELLLFLSQPENRHIWLLLDIKTDNIAEDVMQGTMDAIAKINPDPAFWAGRIQLGIWSIDWIPLCVKHLPGFPIIYIGFSVSAANTFFPIQDVNFNMFFPSVVGPFGSSFMKKARASGRDVFVWTVNDEVLMKWSIQLGVDGVCTDDPEKFLEVCKKYKYGTFEEEIQGRRPLKSILWVWWCVLLLPFFSVIFRSRFRVRSRVPEIGQ